MDLFPVDWRADDADDQYRITVFGKSLDRQLVAAHIAFFPFFYVQLPPDAGPGQVQLFITESCMKYKALRQYCRPVKKVSMWGFTNSTQLSPIQLAFPTYRKMKWAARELQHKYRVYESTVDPLIRFFHVRDIQPSQWIRIDNYAPAPTNTTRAPAEVSVSFDRVSQSTVTAIPPLVFASWDLECYSPSRKFPCADNPGDAIIQIATSFQRYGDAAPYRQLVLCLKTTAAVEGLDIVSFEDEHDMINAWFGILREEHVDVMLGYNTDQFDQRYLHGRSLVCVDDDSGESLVNLGELGRCEEGGGMLRERELNSGAYGQNKFCTLTTPGILQLDLLQHMRKEYKLESYSLNNVSKKFLGDSKVDLPAGEIFSKFEGTAADRALIAEYAAKDTLLPLQLMAKLCVFENLAEMANATFVPLDYVLKRGQQVKVYSVLMRKARSLGYACPDSVGIGAVGKFTGATVLNAEKGGYFDIVCALDYCSLYPSIIRAWNLCYSTIVLDPRYDNLPGVNYYEVSTDQGTFRFAQGVPSVLPHLLTDLAEFRKAAKRKMADAKQRGDAFAAAIHNGSQLAFKVTMNSAYGFAGASQGFLPCVPIAASVTATGRLMIQKTKMLVEQLIPGSRVVYGDTDSVMCILNLGEDKRHDLHAHFTVAEKLAADISETFAKPVELEFEKAYYPYLLFSKKRYAGLMYTSPDAPDKIDMKGIQMVRRDSCPLVREVGTAILHKIMYDRSVDAAVAAAKACILKILRGEEPLDKFVVSKTLKTDYKNQAQPHLYVAKKLFKRTGASIPSGVRVPYVFIHDPANPDGLLAERAEDPDYVAQHNLPIDVLYYINHQLDSPVTALLELLVDNPHAAIFEDEEIQPCMEDLTAQRDTCIRTAKRIRKNVASAQREITEFFRPST